MDRLGFNTLLRDEGIDLRQVKLLRHQDTRSPGRPSPYQLWAAGDGQFELYQTIQRRSVFQGAAFLASFVATPLDETLFVGLYTVAGAGTAPIGLHDPISGVDVGGYHLYDLAEARALSSYQGRLTIAWGQGYRSWVQLAHKQDKPIVEISRAVRGQDFPGFLDFQARLSELAALPLSWRTTLSSVAGVYLLTHPANGKQYVGSAQGAGGLWGRWEEYVASGHGGNRRMQDIPAADYHVSVLEVAASSADVDTILRIEMRWKLKLQTRQFGLNAN